jgi:hypothetical protein
VDELHLVERICLTCKSPVQGMREYCSDDCYHERKRFMRRNGHPTPVCVLCSKEFVRSGNRQKVCTDCRLDKTRLYTKQYNISNKDIVNEKARIAAKNLRKENPKKISVDQKKWRDNNADIIKARRTTPEARAKAAAIQRRRGLIDPVFRTHKRVASAIYQALKKKKNGRKWEDLVGYTCVDLTRHLERQFVQGMTWDNMGEWHIDHIVPKSTFKYKDADDPEFKACWALTNLRPLWAPDNQTKHAYREFLL